ncbi:hypothetical protein HLY00_4477 [Mycolicibacterium hippocampi]|uniref:Uncharacterized protein n=2 Tax=Mycobacteriaceae TaxID=1762 RepID=A0A850PV16_9MYCO|nr:hypothetical protein [Mycolicibacterium hippocampi]
MACRQGGLVADVVIAAAGYVRLAGHYERAPDLCHPSDPQSMGTVENVCGHAREDLAVRSLTEAAVT